MNLRESVRPTAWKVSLAYATAAGLWLFGSERFFDRLEIVGGTRTFLETATDLAFIGVTTLLLYFMAGRLCTRQAKKTNLLPLDEDLHPHNPFRQALPFLIFLILAVAIGTGGFLFFDHLAQASRQEKMQDLAAIASLKESQIIQWRKEHLSHVREVTGDALFLEGVEQFTEGKTSLAPRLQQHLSVIRQAYGYDAVMILDRSGKVLLQSGNPGDLVNLARDKALEAVRSGEIILFDFHRGEGELADIHLDLLAPLKVVRGGERKTAGVLLFRIDPKQDLYPIVHSWPELASSAESVLIRREGEEIVHLSQVRHHPQSLLGLRKSLEFDRLPSVMAGRGITGPVEGIDYRGVSVLAAIQPIAETPWFLICKIDCSEVEAPIQKHARTAAGLSLLGIAGTGFATILWSRQRRDREALQRLNDRRVLEEHYAHLTRHANDIILLVEEQGTIMEANDRASSAYGMSRKELLGRNVRHLAASEAPDDFADHWKRSESPDGVRFETVHRRSDGSSFPVEVSARGIEYRGRRYVQSIIRDITERRHTEERIFRLTNLYAALSQTNQTIVRASCREELFREICRIAVTYGQIKLASILWVDPRTRTVRPVAHYGMDENPLEATRISTDPEIPEGRGPTGIAIREDRPFICHDISMEPVAAYWQEWARGAGLRSSCAFPLRFRGEVVGTLNLYAEEAGFFDRPMIDLLDEMATDISFALENFSREAERRRAEEDRKASQDELLFALEASRMVSWNWDIAAGQIRRSGSLSELLGTPGISAEVSVGQFLSRIHPEDRGRVEKALMEEGMKGRPYRAEFRIRRADGAVVWVEDTGRLVVDEEGNPRRMGGIMRDISDRKEAEEHIRYLAHHDGLTGLPNRTLLMDRLEQVLVRSHRSGNRAALLSLDLDRFKNVNESLGHTVGDQMLLGIAERLKDCVRNGDTVSRPGGDEFIIILPDLRGGDDAARVADKILGALGEPFLIDGHSLNATFSIGISLYPEDGESCEALLKNADAAMYHAKESGRNNYQFFAREMNLHAFERLTLENSLRPALERGEFFLHYQPQIDLVSGRVIGMEALIRWNHPDMGLLPPGKFIPVAEESGLIIPIGEWVLREACRQNRQWQMEGLPSIPVAVNLSALQFRSRGLEQAIAEALSSSGLDACCLELELTESVLMQQEDSVLEKVRRLKKLGLKLSIDDFGTGFSNLGYLKRFTIDKLKIDRTFIKDVCSDSNDAAITTAIIQLSHSLGLQVIAEGVETVQQLEFLRRHGCDEVQGFLFSRPLPPNLLPELLQKPFSLPQA